MAKPRKIKKQPKKTKGKKPGGANATGVFIILTLIAISVFSRGSALALATGLLPTYVLLLQRKSLYSSLQTQVVGFSNLAGVLPFVVSLWDNQPVMEVLGQPVAWVIMYGAAGAGYLLLYIGPMMAAAGLQITATERSKKLLKMRQKYIEEWGPEVAVTTEQPAPSGSKVL